MHSQQWQILILRSGLAEGLQEDQRTVPIDLTSASWFASDSKPYGLQSAEYVEYQWWNEKDMEIVV
jgi:hypothetical protein